MPGIGIDNYMLFWIFHKVKYVLYNILTIFDFWSMYAWLDVDKNDKTKEDVMSTTLKIHRRWRAPEGLVELPENRLVAFLPPQTS